MIGSRLNRRRFLKGTAVAAAAPLVITSTALGDANTPPASERVTLGHIGVGNQGGTLFRMHQFCKAAQSVAVADAYKDRREAFARQVKGTAYADFRELLARNDIDAVVIATPDHWHVPIAIAAARAKKDAYVEKPLGVSIGQDLACQKVFAENARVFQYGTQQRNQKHCQFGCELVRSGRIGKVHTIEVIAPNGNAGGDTKVVPVPRGFDYEMWCGPAPVRPYTPDRCHPPGTYFIYDYSIGYLGGWGAHPLDIMVWGSKADLAGPITVEGTGEIPTKGLYDVVYNWDMKIQLGDGVKMTFTPGGDSTKFIGPDGWVRICRGGIDAEPKSLLTSKIGPDGVHLGGGPASLDSVAGAGYSNSSRAHCQDFVEAVKSRKPAISPLDHAIRSDIISHLCDIAVRTRQQVTWDPQKQAIVGMNREMRPPWTL